LVPVRRCAVSTADVTRVTEAVTAVIGAAACAVAYAEGLALSRTQALALASAR
jgi:hypothetical protein